MSYLLLGRLTHDVWLHWALRREELLDRSRLELRYGFSDQGMLDSGCAFPWHIRGRLVGQAHEPESIGQPVEMFFADLLIDLVVFDQLVRDCDSFLGRQLLCQVVVPAFGRFLVMIDIGVLSDLSLRYDRDGAILVVPDDVLLGGLLGLREGRHRLHCR